MPPGSARWDGAVFPPPQAGGGPRDLQDRSGWVARVADGPYAGAALGAERSRENLHAAVLARGLPRWRAVCLHPALDLAAARREALVAERSQLRRAVRACGGVGGAVLGVACAAFLVAWLDAFRSSHPAQPGGDPATSATVALAEQGRPAHTGPVNSVPDLVSGPREHFAARGDTSFPVARYGDDRIVEHARELELVAVNRNPALTMASESATLEGSKVFGLGHLFDGGLGTVHNVADASGGPSAPGRDAVVEE